MGDWHEHVVSCLSSQLSYFTNEMLLVLAYISS